MKQNHWLQSHRHAQHQSCNSVGAQMKSVGFVGLHHLITANNSRISGRLLASLAFCVHPPKCLSVSPNIETDPAPTSQQLWHKNFELSCFHILSAASFQLTTRNTHPDYSALRLRNMITVLNALILREQKSFIMLTELYSRMLTGKE